MANIPAELRGLIQSHLISFHTQAPPSSLSEHPLLLYLERAPYRIGKYNDDFHIMKQFTNTEHRRRQDPVGKGLLVRADAK